MNVTQQPAPSVATVPGFVTCNAPDCKWIARIEGVALWTRWAPRGEAWVAVRLAECHNRPACPTHPYRGTRLTAVVGDYAPDVPCGPRCQDARSPLCSCSCAGTRHGLAHK